METSQAIKNNSSIPAREWRKLNPPPPGFSDALKLSPFQSHLLYNRGIRHLEEVEPFLSSDSRLLNDPMLLPDMDKAVFRLKNALANRETIGIFGDFDTDGITGTALLTIALRDIGAEVVPYLPNRMDEGHGLNEQAIDYLRELGVSLMLTVDCGVTSVKEVKIAASMGIETIVTDHHSLMPDMPDACAIINPKRPDSEYPYPHLTGVGMAFKLVEALYEALGQPWPGHLLELVALGTVADVGPLTGENRFFVKKGLEQLNITQNPGIQALAASANLKLGSLDTESLSFGLIPRINVAGRLDHPGTSLALLTATSLHEAEPLADELSKKNYERQRLTEQGVQEAISQVEATSHLSGVPSIIIVSSDQWLPGILGLIAAKLSDHYYRPVIAISLDPDYSRASARSIPEFNVVEALRTSSDLFTRFGGHPQAAGFTITTNLLPKLERSVSSVADEFLGQKDLRPSIEVDCEVSPGLFAEQFAFIQSLAPFGEGNRAPIFLTRKANVLEARQVGSGGSHLKMRVAHSNAVMDAIAFRQGRHINLTRNRIDLVYNIGLDTWRGRSKLQMTVMDFRPSD